MLFLLEAVLFPLVEEISLGTAKVDDLGTSVSILLLDAAFLTIVSIGDTRTSTDDTPSLIRTIVTLIAYADESCGSDIRVTDDTLAITLLT